MTPDWKAYQEEAAAFFRSLGLEATTDKTVSGARTKHDIDVFVVIDMAGFEVRWVVECKHWKTPVTKLHVMALREIVADIGADRGILLCEAGFQSGAIAAANLTNIQVTSLAAVTISSMATVYGAKLRDLYDRNEVCRETYWDIPKHIRIQKGLRGHVGQGTHYSGARTLGMTDELLSQGLRGRFPVIIHPAERLNFSDVPEQIVDVKELVVVLEPMIAELEEKLQAV
jgi:restriction system protein